MKNKQIFPCKSASDLLARRTLLIFRHTNNLFPLIFNEEFRKFNIDHFFIQFGVINLMRSDKYTASKSDIVRIDNVHYNEHPGSRNLLMSTV